MPEIVKEITCKAPINIAVIKYWGKRDEELVLATNASLSVTLSTDKMYSQTTARASPSYTADQLILNGSSEGKAVSGRIQRCLRELRAKRQLLESRLPSLHHHEGNHLHSTPLSTWPLCIESINSFPTAAGLASSASGLACLVYAVAQLYHLLENEVMSLEELSAIARLGSGSACRSIFGGYVKWNVGERGDGADSIAVQVAPKNHWPEMRALILIVNAGKKDVSSTDGMQLTILTSPLFQHRLRIVPERMQQMETAIIQKDFASFAELTMRDSNQFHAVCLDTYPPITYLNDTSRAIMRLISMLNHECGMKAAYTFDAGPNAVIYLLKEHVAMVMDLLLSYFPAPNSSSSDYLDLDDFQRDHVPLNLPPFSSPPSTTTPLLSTTSILREKFPNFNTKNCEVKKIIYTSVGDGPFVVSQ